MRSAFAIVFGVVVGIMISLGIYSIAVGIWLKYSTSRPLGETDGMLPWLMSGLEYSSALLAGYVTAWRDPSHPWRSATISGFMVALALAASWLGTATMPGPRFDVGAFAQLAAITAVKLIAVALGGAGLRQWIRPVHAAVAVPPRM